MSIEYTRFSLPLSRPLGTARGTIETRDGMVVAVARDGTAGIGEATPLPGWTESLEECERALDRAATAIEPDGWEGALGSLDGSPAARHGLAGALGDARARAAGLPLYRCLGDDRRIDRVPVNATVGDGTPEETAAAATRALEDGFSCVKCKVGVRSIERDVARLEAVREVAPEAELRVDANGGWSSEEAREALDRFEAFDPAYVEQPLSAGALAECATLRATSAVPIALDETLTEYAVPTILAADAADALVCKPMVLGGPDRAVEAARAARSAGVMPVVTSTIDGVVARTVAVHVAASLAPTPACGLATADRLEADLAEDPAPIDGGAARVPQAAGVAGSRFDGLVDGRTDGSEP